MLHLRYDVSSIDVLSPVFSILENKYNCVRARRFSAEQNDEKSKRRDSTLETWIVGRKNTLDAVAVYVLLFLFRFLSLLVGLGSIVFSFLLVRGTRRHW